MNKIRELRQKARLTQLRLYLKSGVNCATISLIERGLLVASERQQKKLARAFKVSVGELFPVTSKSRQDENLNEKPALEL